MNHQQLLVVVPDKKEFQPSDEFLFDLAHQILGTQKPSALKMGMKIGQDTFVDALVLGRMIGGITNKGAPRKILKALSHNETHVEI